MINENTIRQWWDIFKAPSMLTEVRVLGHGKTFSGYFTDPETLIEKIGLYDGYGLYATINEVKESCYGRTQHDVILGKVKATTSDSDIEHRRWILLDFDPDRPSDTNSSDDEKRQAEISMRTVYKFLRNQGFYAPVVADSANGYHLYYSVDLPNTKDSADLVKNFLQALDMMFSNEHVKVDTSVFNASRIAKIIGTSSAKGSNMGDRPQRQSCFIHVPDVIGTTQREYIEKIASMLPVPEAPSRMNNWSRERFDIEGFIQRNGIEVVKRTRFGGGEKLVLAECPFDPNHKAPDAAIFVMDSGAIGFRCLHNSCQHYTWKDVRLHFDPQAYDRRDREAYFEKRSYYGRTAENQEPVLEQEDARGHKWRALTEILWKDPMATVCIPSGFTKLDHNMGGFAQGDVTILSGLSGAGKTTLINHFILNAVHRGYKAAAWSGELQDYRFQAWLDQMAAGKNFVRQRAGYDNYWYAPKNVSAQINDWLDGKFWLYNNDYGSRWSQLLSDIKEVVHEQGVQIIFLDNLMALDLEGAASDNDAQTTFIKQAKDLAKSEGIHVFLVCHPRKEQSFQLLRKESIAGTANLTNLCDNLLISHRVGRDFERRAKDFFGEETVQKLMDYNLILEIAKNRSLGCVDVVLGLYYENETRRVKENKEDEMVYGWQEEPTAAPMFPGSTTEDIPDSAWFNNF